MIKKDFVINVYVKFNQCIIKLKTMSTIMFLFWTKPMSSSEYTPRIRAHIIIVIIYSICKVNLTFFVLIRYACNTFCMKIWILVFEWNIAKVRMSLEWKLITVRQHHHASLDIFWKFGNSIIGKCVIYCSHIHDKWFLSFIS